MAAERREKEALERRLAAPAKIAAGSAGGVSSAGGGAGGENGAMDEDGDDGEEDDASRELREAKLGTAIPALEAVASTEDPKLTQLRLEKDSISRQRREGRPLKTQLLAIDRRMEKKKKSMAATAAKIAEVHRKQGELRKEL